MPDKKVVMILMVIGSTVGGYVPVIFGADFLSLWSLVGTFVGGVLGIWLAFRISPD